MSCCVANTAGELGAVDHTRAAKLERYTHAGFAIENENIRYVFSLPDIHCGACIGTIERAIKPLDGVVLARVNLTLKRLNLEVDKEVDILSIVERIESLGFSINPIDIGDLEELEENRAANNLLKALAVAGFAAANIMLLSVSVWSGAVGPTRDLFHLISAIIAVPVVVYSGQPFFTSAFAALKAKRLNMDVPISLAVILALGMSIYETLIGSAEAYFDAAVTLLFFLLIGRYLDQLMRDKARRSVMTLAKMAAKGANIVLENGTLDYTSIDEIEVGMVVRIFPGDRIPLDGKVISGSSDLDCSIATGESEPIAASKGYEVIAGSANLTGSIDVEVTKIANESFLSEVLEMLQAAENGRGKYVRIADKMARIYAPAVHLLSLIAFIIWMFATSSDVHQSLMIAISVLIVTCPCALGLAVPVVHVIGASCLFQKGILMRDGSALERLAEVDKAIFDKTGTLTTGVPTVSELKDITDQSLPILKALATHSSHPAAKAVVRFAKCDPSELADSFTEVPGYGVEAIFKGKKVRLGRADWVQELTDKKLSDNQLSGLRFVIEGETIGAIELRETLRPDAASTIEKLDALKIDSGIISGDGKLQVQKIAQSLNVANYEYAQTPKSKLQHIEKLATNNDKVLMVGDGMNDAPCLAASYVSMAPAAASDVGRQAADFIFTHQSLGAASQAVEIARYARKIIKQNFGLALLYNAIAVPLAIGGMVTPLFAAIAMSASSILVVANSMRLYAMNFKKVETNALNQNTANDHPYSNLQSQT